MEKEITWFHLRVNGPKKVLKELGVNKFRVRMQQGGYLNVYYHSRWPKDMGWEQYDGFVENVKTKERVYICQICDGTWRVRYIVPYDAAKPPGWYCTYCRKKHSLMDVKDAKRYGKVF